MENQEMDLDTYYAEQEIRLNLPHESIEQYQLRLAELKRQSQDQHVDLPPFPAAWEMSSSGFVGHSGNISKRKMSPTVSEAAGKRHRIGDQDGSNDQAAGTRKVFGPHLSSSGQRDPSIQAATIQQRAKAHSDTTKCDVNRPQVSALDLEVSTYSKILSSQTTQTNLTNPQVPSYTATVTRAQMSSSQRSEGVYEDIESFTEAAMTSSGSKINYAARNADILAAAQDSPITSFSRTSGDPAKRHRCHNLKPVRRKYPLDLHPVDIPQPRDHSIPAMSPIEGLSTKSDSSESVNIQTPFSAKSNAATRGISRQAHKHHHKSLEADAKQNVHVMNNVTLFHAKEDGSDSVSRTPSSPSSADVVHAGPSESSRNAQSMKPTVEKRKLKKREKLPPMTPADYARLLQAKAAVADTGVYEKGCNLKKRQKTPIVKFLEGKNIFYAGGDMKYASETTRGRMNIIIKFGGNLMPEFDSQVTTHVITDASIPTTLRALGLKNLREIPNHIPTVRWSWLLSVLGKESFLSKREIDEKLGDTWLHAAFSKRMDAGYQPQKTISLAALKDRTHRKILEVDREDRICIAVCNQSGQREERADQFVTPLAPSIPSNHLIDGAAGTSEVTTEECEFGVFEDPLAPFYRRAEIEKLRDDESSSLGWPEQENSDDEHDKDSVSIESKAPVKRGWTCDAKAPRLNEDSPNQDIIDKLMELMQIHKSKLGDEDHWRAYTYSKCIRALKNYPKRIKSYEEARNIRGVGDRTAQKIEEILQTGDLRRIKYEKTEDVAVTRLFQGIYGVGRSTAFQWYAMGCRTLRDLEDGKGGVKLTAAQEIGLRYYDDINSRMPREEAKVIFDVVKDIGMSIDAGLLIEIMGSYRRGKATCGDIDILITRPTHDGKTHSGVLPRLLQRLRAEGVIAEDLAVPDDPDDLEAIYRGLCRLPGVPNARRRRIDFLSIPWKSRGAAFIYYTGDDIFNRAMRLKANVMGYSLNQRGLYSNVVRNPSDRGIKFNDGILVASETEEEIFKILGVPWQEPHERVRG